MLKVHDKLKCPPLKGKNFNQTYKNPFKNLNRTRNQNDFAKLETIVMPKAMSKLGTITDFLPLVSARKPHKCDDTIIPINPIPLRIPLFWFVRFRSHCATGRIKLMLTVSRKTQPRAAPHKSISR